MVNQRLSLHRGLFVLSGVLFIAPFAHAAALELYSTLLFSDGNLLNYYRLDPVYSIPGDQDEKDYHYLWGN